MSDAMLTHLREQIHPVFLFIITITICGCTDKEPLPSGEIKSNIDGNVVTFTVEAENADGFLWDFGDGTAGSTEKDPVHVFEEFGKDYSVSLRMTGPGGETELTELVTIPEMTPFEMLTGGKGNADGKRWKIKSSGDIIIARADASFTVMQVLPGTWLNQIGFTNAYSDEYVFKYNGNYSIIPGGVGIIAGLTYCNSKNIPNTPPGNDAQMAGLTSVNTYSTPEGLKFAFSESGNYTLQVSDGSSSGSIILPDVMTLKFSKGGFLGISNWLTDCVITTLSTIEMKVALFDSDIPAGTPYAGITNKVLIITFESVE